MFVGHYAVSYALKRVDPQASLGQLFLAVQLADVAWSSFVLLGIEKVKYQPGFMAASPLNLYFMPFSHSMVSVLVWAAAAAMLILLLSRRPAPQRRRTALVMAGAVFSHWLLDVPVHGPDLPLVGDLFKVGLGLWNHPIAAWLVESGVLIGGLMIYLRGRSKPAIGMMIFTAVLLLINTANLLAPQPIIPEPVYATMALISYLLFAFIAQRLDRQAA